MTRIRLDVVPGLVPVLLDELGTTVDERTEAFVVLDMDRRDALHLRTAYAAYAVATFDVRAPKALLGDANLKTITKLVGDVARSQPFTAVRIGAAGADSPVMRRIGDELATAARLPHDPAHGDLLVRIIRSGREDGGWQVLVRLTPRPLSNRPWHVAGFEGAIDASVAAAMVRLTDPRPDDVFLDPTSGSNTIVLERRHHGPARLALGSDLSADARAEVRADASRLPLADATVTALAANPPWNHRFEADENLHAALLAEAGRVATLEARFVVLTHDIRRFERALRDQHRWQVQQQLKLDLRGHHPRLYVLTDSTAGGAG